MPNFSFNYIAAIFKRRRKKCEVLKICKILITVLIPKTDPARVIDDDCLFLILYIFILDPYLSDNHCFRLKKSQESFLCLFFTIIYFLMSFFLANKSFLCLIRFFALFRNCGQLLFNYIIICTNFLQTWNSLFMNIYRIRKR